MPLTFQNVTLLRGDLRQALSFANSYGRLLIDHDIPHEPLAKPFWELSDDQVKYIGKD